MGLATSLLMGKGPPTTQMLNLITGSLYNSFVDKETNDFAQFHEAFLEIFNTFNSALPGKHYDVPSRQEIQEYFTKWKNAKDETTKKHIFIDFIQKRVGLNKPDQLTLIAGLVTPPTAMLAKKTGERVPALKLVKTLPDVLFIPSITFLALISVKVSRKVFHKRMVQQHKQNKEQNGTV